jgi:hypothetical protein
MIGFHARAHAGVQAFGAAAPWIACIAAFLHDAIKLGVENTATLRCHGRGKFILRYRDLNRFLHTASHQNKLGIPLFTPVGAA